MHITLHLTTGCNMKCDYCYAPPVNRIDMSESIVMRSIEYGSSLCPENTGIIFFGGEPLLRKDLIYTAVAFCEELKKRHGYRFHYKVTTNGLLLDEAFLEYCDSVNLLIALSIDGIKKSHDTHRKNLSGKPTFEVLEPKIALLLKHQPYACFFMTVTPENVKFYAQSFEYLIKKGARYIIASLNYAGNWNDENLKELKKQYRLLSQKYEKLILEQKKFYFSPFEMKFSSHIKNNNKICEKCHLGIRQISIASDGNIYPCVQFVSKPEYCIGNIRDGINNNKKMELYRLSQEQKIICSECAINQRCNNDCSCLNIQTTGNINTVSPVLCETEKILTPIVDKLGERLFKMHAPMFIQKHYNSDYPYLSLFEDILS